MTNSKYKVTVTRPLTSSFYSKNMGNVQSVIEEVLEQECTSDLKGVLRTIEIKKHEEKLSFIY